MYAKILITGTLELKTGLHIGGSDAFAAIGATDSPVIKDPLTKRPVIPGSSIKGKMRSLLAQMLNTNPGTDHNQDDDKIKRLFGATKPKVIAGRLVFRDLVLSETEEERLSKLGAKDLTEVKFENTINRITAVAMPRQIERAIRGSRFEFSLVYTLDKLEDAESDFQTVADGLRLLELDYLGGGGTRGNGRVRFTGLKATRKVGEVEGEGEILTSLNDKLKSLDDMRVGGEE